MNIFNNIKSNEKGIIFNAGWVEWKHGNITTSNEIIRVILLLILKLFRHCNQCIKLDGCYFMQDKAPDNPLHLRCHCWLKNISTSQVDFQATAICPEEKLKGYALANHLQSNGKNTIFSKLGFTQDNAFELKQLLEKQAIESYKKGQYILGYLDEHGQRIRIKIAIKGYEFYSAWMVEPMGLIRLITPFGGWVNGKE